MSRKHKPNPSKPVNKSKKKTPDTIKFGDHTSNVSKCERFYLTIQDDNAGFYLEKRTACSIKGNSIPGQPVCWYGVDVVLDAFDHSTGQQKQIRPKAFLIPKAKTMEEAAAGFMTCAQLAARFTDQQNKKIEAKTRLEKQGLKLTDGDIIIARS